LSESEFAQFSFFQSTFIYVALIVSFYLHVPFLKNICKTTTIQEKIFLTTNILTVYTLYCLFIGFVVFLNIEIALEIFANLFHLQNDISLKFILYINIVLINFVTTILYSLNISLQKPLFIIFHNGIRFLVLAILSIFFLYSEDYCGIIVRLAVILSVEIFTVVVYFIIFSRYSFLKYINLELLFGFLKESVILLPSGILSLLLAFSDRNLIAPGNSIELACMSLAFQILLPLTILTTSIQTILSPKLFQESKYNLSFFKFFNYLSIFTLVSISYTFFSFLFIYYILDLQLINNSYNDTCFYIFLLLPKQLTICIYQFFSTIYNYYDCQYLSTISIFIICLVYLCTIEILFLKIHKISFLVGGIFSFISLIGVFIVFIFYKKRI